jgi:hypothetical protein
MQKPGRRRQFRPKFHRRWQRQWTSRRRSVPNQVLYPAEPLPNFCVRRGNCRAPWQIAELTLDRNVSPTGSGASAFVKLPPTDTRERLPPHVCTSPAGMHKPPLPNHQTRMQGSCLAPQVV